MPSEPRISKMSAHPHHIRIFLCEKRRDLTLLLKNGREIMITSGAFHT
jgi:hypothetical protein